MTATDSRRRQSRAAAQVRRTGRRGLRRERFEMSKDEKLFIKVLLFILVSFLFSLFMNGPNIVSILLGIILLIVVFSMVLDVSE